MRKKANSKNSRRTRRKRNFFTKYRICSFLLVLLIIFAITRVKAEGKKEIQYQEVIVQPGDTLWALAKKHKDSSTDIRDYIAHIQQLNQIRSIIHPGDVLVFPSI